MRVGPLVGPGGTWGEGRALSGPWEFLGGEVGPSVGIGSTWGDGGALSGAREHLG